MTTMWHLLPLLLALTSSFVDAQYYGERVGDLSQNAHDVSGTVYIVDSTRIRIRNFNYDGTGPDAFFWIGDGTDEPSEQGYISPNEMGRNDVLGMYQNADIILTLPDGWTVSRLKWLSVWCRRFAVDFGSIQFPGQSSCVPAATDIGMFTGYAHDVASGSVHVLDAKTIKIEGFYYDGLGPDAYFYVGTGDVSVANGYRVPVGLDTTTATILEMYENATIQLRLPGDITVQDITWISVYCVSASTNFGDIQVSADLCVPPYTGAPMYFGEVIGALSTMAYEVSGLVHVVDSKRLFIQGFSYTGQGPDAYFYVGLEGQHGPAPAAGGIIVPNEMGSNEKLGRYDDVDVVLSMPGAITTDQIIWFSVWCEDVGVDFGSVVFPENFLVPAQVSIGPFVQTAHAVSSGDVTIVDKRTLRIPAFSYDGLAPDTFFIVGSGTPSSFGIKVPNELGSMAKLERYDNKDITLVLPSGLDVDRIDYISVYCVSASESFGQIMFPDPPINVPPFLPGAPLGLLPYCKAMSENFNVAWDVTDTHIIFEYTGNIGTTNGYMAFGVSGSESRSAMIGADPAIVYLDNGSPTVEDFTINEYSLCAGGRGVCRDTNQDINGNNNVEILDMRLVEGVTRVRFQRPLAAADAETDKTISTDNDMFVVWAVGEVNSFGQVTKHPERLIGNMQINFGSPAASDCQEIQGIPPPEVEPWPMLTLSGEDNKVFYAKIGLSGGKKGYGGITGNTPWGIAWYINGILIPEITVKRGETFTFYVEGGDDTSNNAQYHPFYITDDAQGGYFTKSEEERQNIALYAGTTENNGVVMGTDGRYCEYKGNANPEDFDTFEAYNATLTLECAEGDAGMFTWTPDENTPDLVYYQCFTHNFLGWKIHVVDEYEVNGGQRVYVSVLGIVSLLMAHFVSHLFC